MTDVGALPPGDPRAGFGVPDDGPGAALARLAYLLVGDHVAARAALAEALSGDVARGDGAVLEVVRQALAREGLVDRSRDDDFWRGGAWALQKLPPDQRVLVSLSVGLGMSDADVAGLLDTPERTVRRRLLAGRAALAAQLGLDREDTGALDAAVLQIADRHQPAPDRPAGAAGTVAGGAALPATAEVDVAGPRRPLRVRRGVWVGALGAAAGLGLVTVLAWPSGRDGISLVAAPTPTPTASGQASPPPVATTTSAEVPPTAEPTASAAAPRTTSTRRSSSRTTARTTSSRPATTSTRTTKRPGATTRTTRTTKTTRTTTTTRRPTPTPTPVPAGLVRGAASGLCLDAGSASPGWGTQVRLAECAGGAPQTAGSAQPETVTIAGLCLDGFGWGTSPGTAVVLWDCHGGTNQRWQPAPNGALRNVHAGLCVAPTGQGAGATLVLASCDGSDGQSWQRT